MKYLYKYEADDESGKITKTKVEVLGVEREADVGTERYVVEGGFVSKFFDVARVGNPVWLEDEDDKLARKYIVGFFESSLALVKEQALRIKRVIKAVSAEA